MKLAITIDVDWAPDWAIRCLSEFLTSTRTPATWFITHMSDAIEELQEQQALFELGIHPNFLAASTHGKSPAEVLMHCMALVPKATSMRTHALVQSTHILQSVVDHTPVIRDCSIYLRDLHTDAQTARVLPLDNARELTRIPYQWEDDLEFFAADPIWDGRDLVTRHQHDEYLAVDIHPIHFALNTAGISDYREVKRLRPDLQNLDPSAIGALRDLSAPGAMSFTKSLVKAGHSNSFTELVRVEALS